MHVHDCYLWHHYMFIGGSSFTPEQHVTFLLEVIVVNAIQLLKELLLCNERWTRGSLVLWCLLSHKSISLEFMRLVINATCVAGNAYSPGIPDFTLLMFIWSVVWLLLVGSGKLWTVIEVIKNQPKTIWLGTSMTLMYAYISPKIISSDHNIIFVGFTMKQNTPLDSTPPIMYILTLHF